MRIEVRHTVGVDGTDTELSVDTEGEAVPDNGVLFPFAAIVYRLTGTDFAGMATPMTVNK